MSVAFNHTIVWCRDQARSAGFLAQILGRPEPTRFMHFLVVALDNGVSLDFLEAERPIASQHYAFLISEAEFDSVFARIEAQGLEYWADPARTQAKEIYRHNGGRGLYFQDPDRHLLEVMTRPYGSDS